MKKVFQSVLALLLVSMILLVSCTNGDDSTTGSNGSNGPGFSEGSFSTPNNSSLNDSATSNVQDESDESDTGSNESMNTGSSNGTGTSSTNSNDASSAPESSTAEDPSDASQDANESQTSSVVSNSNSNASNGSNGNTSSESVATHRHQYSKIVVPPTCAAKGYTKYICDTCNDSYIGDEKAAVAHDMVFDWEVEPTQNTRGKRVTKCAYGCGKTETVEYYSYNEYAKLIVPRVLYWLNTYRAKEGAPAVVLSNKETEFNQYRAMQLVTNFAHSYDDANAAAAATKCGVYFEDYPNPDTGEIIPAHWEAVGYGECIARSNIPEIVAVGDGANTDLWAKSIVDQFKTSTAHWNILSAKEDFTIYIGIGVYRGRVCIGLTSENQDVTGYQHVYFDENGELIWEYVKP